MDECSSDCWSTQLVSLLGLLVMLRSYVLQYYVPDNLTYVGASAGGKTYDPEVRAVCQMMGNGM